MHEVRGDVSWPQQAVSPRDTVLPHKLFYVPDSSSRCTRSIGLVNWFLNGTRPEGPGRCHEETRGSRRALSLQEK